MNYKTTVTLSQGNLEVQESTTALLEHLALNPPAEQSVDYNGGLALLFEVLRSTFHNNNDNN